jgi:hypothetical protein
LFCYKRWRFESYRTEIPSLQLTFEIMRTEIPKLQKIFDAYSVHRAEAGAMHENQVTDEGRLGADLGCYRDWAQRIEAMYSSHTLCRMLYSTDSRTREAAAWGLGLIGEEIALDALGPCLRDPFRGVRTAVDEARRTILARTQSPWHRETAQNIEDLLARARLGEASHLADLLVEETESRSDAFMLRAWVRFSNQRMDWAAEDCKKTLSIDPFCYRACVALGQCFWHQNRDAAARECCLEAARLYPDWEPAYSALRSMQRSRSLA